MKTYGNLTKKQIEEIVNHPDFDKMMQRAQANMDDFVAKRNRLIDEDIKRSLNLNGPSLSKD